ncbi:flagellar hook protein FlgE [Stieleria varia]|uniref:Flagellar hook protein FlgE n=1 Tax=Stieleria varia TaxID=2528005 RepID=A0A5C6AQ45_9BACT|nr:flagellar hook-basal body complex protein [Stieleria varia]TWU02163.1 Flagellar hook protein FlgE [Stieleria varia]
MSRALMTGITGLRTHQQKLDVVSNNIANMNTIGFKAQTTTFSDLMYVNTRSASGPTDTSGGINPMSIGSGVQMAQISRRFTQGTLQSTGELLDFAIEGDGFFTLAQPSGENVYTRAGSFTVDASGRLVDPATGFLVQRIGTVGEPTPTEVGFQVPNDKSIQIPIGANVPGEPTQNLSFLGNLPSSSRPPAAEVLSSNSAFETGGGPAILTTLLDDLDLNTVNYGAGDQLEINGTNPDGTPFSSLFNANGATMGDLVNELNTLLTGATAALNPDGTLAITADDTGEAYLSVIIRDAAGNVGGTNFAGNSFIATTEGRAGDTYELSMEVYDVRGESHRVTFEFLKTDSNSWNITAGINPESGVMIDDSVMNLTFNDDGTYALVGAGGVGDADIEINFTDIDNPQTIALDFQQLDHMASGFTLTQRQDGSPPGAIASLAITAGGELSGLATNGKSVVLAQLAMASFLNSEALTPIGGNYFEQSSNSGQASMGEGATGGRGSVLGGQLEGSNVDIAEEFTQLIVAQRGFSANARTITVAADILEELTNIIR